MTDQTAKTVEITIDPLRKRIRIHRETLKQLHYPAYVQFLVNPEKSYMAVLGSDQPLRGGTANRLRINPDRLPAALPCHGQRKPPRAGEASLSGRVHSTYSNVEAICQKNNPN